MVVRRSLRTTFIVICLVALSLTPVAATGQKEKTEAATITLWTGYSETLPVLKAAAADYSKEHPNITFELSNFNLREMEQKLQISMSAGTAPDIGDLNGGLTQRSAAQGYLDALPGKYAGWMKESFDQDFIDPVSQKGKVYGIPGIHGFQLLYYNQDDYAAAGITKPPTTLDELMENARKLTKYDANGKVVHSGISLRLSGQGSGIAEKWEIFAFAGGGRGIEPTGAGTWKAAFNNDAGYNALNFYLNALHKYKVDSFDVKHDEDAFVNGITSQFNRETYIIGSMRSKAPEKKYGITQVVGGPGGRATNLNVDVLVVPASAKHKEAAWDYLTYLMRDKYCVQMMSEVGWIFSRKGVDYSAAYAKEPHFKQALDRPPGFKFHAMPSAVSWAEVYTNLANALTLAYTDASLMDNKPKIMSWLAAQADAANKILRDNKEY